MVNVKFIVFLTLLLHNTFAQQRLNKVGYFEDEVQQTKQPSSLLSTIAQELIRRSSSSSQVTHKSLKNVLKDNTNTKTCFT